jgi:ABC-type multidrug transport system ATPase subunit
VTLRVRGLGATAGPAVLLDDVDLDLEAGRVLAVLGESGSGKSTLGTALLGAAAPGVAVHGDVRAGRVALLPQHPGAVLDPVRRVDRVLGELAGTDRCAVGRALDLAGLDRAVAHRFPHQLSGGQQQRAALAMALVVAPDVLVLDEPTTGLDPEARVAMWEEVGRLAEAETLTILLTTHYLEEADQLADRLAIVSQGKVVVEGTPGELKERLSGDAVQLEVARDAVEQAQGILAGVGALTEQVLEGRTIVARVEDGGRALPGIISALEGAGVPIESVSVSRPSLDDVYLHFTGREFGQEDRAA